MTHKEAKVYLTVLELWLAPASVIARRSWVKRVTAYAVLRELERKHIASSVDKDGVGYYQVVEPSALLKVRQDEVDSFEKVMPELNALSNIYDTRPKIQYFQWAAWIKKLYHDLLDYKEPLFAFLSDDEIDEWLQEYLNEEFHALRSGAGIHASVLVRNTEANAQYLETAKSDVMTEVKLIDDDMHGIEWEIIMYWENKVAFALYSPGEMVWYIIESRQLYQSMKTAFMFMWKRS